MMAEKYFGKLKIYTIRQSIRAMPFGQIQTYNAYALNPLKIRHKAS